LYEHHVHSCPFQFRQELHSCRGTIPDRTGSGGSYAEEKNQAHAADRQKVPRRRRIVFIAKLAPRQVVLPPPTLVEFLLAFLVMSVGNWIGRRNGDFIGFEINCLRMRAALGRSELVLAAELDRFRTSSPVRVLIGGSRRPPPPHPSSRRFTFDLEPPTRTV
jgi:hypothetical protein